MRKPTTLAALAATVGLLFGVAGCASPDNSSQSATTTQTSAADNMTEANTDMQEAHTQASTQPASQAAQPTTRTMAENWFGGSIYNGAPKLKATAALVRAGGGADNFKFSTALVAMLGQDTVSAEVAKLNKQYGEEQVQGFLEGMTYAINDGLKRATEAGVSLPEAPADLKGPALAKALVKAGTTPDGTFWSGHLFDQAISHKLHNVVMADIDAKFGHEADKTTHKILNQAMYDVAQALGMKDVKLADLH